jgi:predicted alpha/beta-hydrolase family hydrolase
MDACVPEKLIVDLTVQHSVTALLYRSKLPAVGTLILAHGAGATQTSPFMVSFATELAIRRIHAVTFNFPYSERGRRVPDPPARLEACYRAVIALVRQRLPNAKLAIGGKSMGGRIASQVAAGVTNDLAGLVLLGYPLHPPNRPTEVRARHLVDIAIPILFVQGSRDSFGTPEELWPIIGTLKAPTHMHIVQCGDHSFKIPRKSGFVQADVYHRVQDEIVRWFLNGSETIAAEPIAASNDGGL